MASTPNTHKQDRTLHIQASGILSPKTENTLANWKITDELSFRLENQEIKTSRRRKKLHHKILHQ